MTLVDVTPQRKAIHHFSFSSKVKHLLRRKFHQAEVSQGIVDAWITERCASCERVGLFVYRFWAPGWLVHTWWGAITGTRHVNRIRRKQIYRLFVLCIGCGHWREVTPRRRAK